MSKKADKAYREGKQAFIERRTLNENPYPIGSTQRRYWGKGLVS